MRRITPTRSDNTGRHWIISTRRRDGPGQRGPSDSRGHLVSLPTRAGERSRRLEPFLEIEGRYRLPDLHDYRRLLFATCANCSPAIIRKAHRAAAWSACRPDRANARRRSGNCCSRRRRVTPETPGHPAVRHTSTRDRIWLTRGISTNTPGSSNVWESGEAMTYPAGLRPSVRSNRHVFRSWRQCFIGS